MCSDLHLSLSVVYTYAIVEYPFAVVFGRHLEEGSALAESLTGAVLRVEIHPTIMSLARKLKI